GRLRAPSAALSVMERAVSDAGVPSVGFFAQVPHYVSAAYPMASLELLRWLGRYLEVELPVGALASRALETRALLDAATAANEQTKGYLEQLEKLADESRQPSGDDLIADIERFLRERSGDDGGGGSGRLN
ncbi:MAG: PAC2 family protein, partial [Chloroflexota bacterium]|nr:PAC2 family protein [Chloroflexota bacterium]